MNIFLGAVAMALVAVGATTLPVAVKKDKSLGKALRNASLAATPPRP